MIALWLWLALAWAQDPPSDPKVIAMVAARDLYPGVPITEKDLYGIEIPRRLLPAEVFLDPDLVVGQRPTERILANEILRAPRFEQPARTEVPIELGQRLVPLEVSLGAAIGGPVALWRSDEERCLLAEGTVADTSPVSSIILPGNTVSAVLRAESAGKLAVTPVAEAAGGTRCSD